MRENQKKIADEQALKLLESGIILTTTDKENLDNIIKEIETLYDSPISPDLTERNAQYETYKNLITKYSKTLADIKYNFIISKKEYLFMKSLIIDKISYDRQNIFVGLLVRDTFFYRYDTNKSSTKTALFSEKDIELFKMDITEITRISHLSGLQEIKGLYEKADIFANITKKIGDISKIFDIYNSKGKDLSEEGGNWIQQFDKYDSELIVEPEQVS